MIFTRSQRLNRRDISPFHHMATLRDELDNLFNQARVPEGYVPALDLYEDKDGLVVKVELPGMKKEDISISLEDEVLTVSGERKYEAPQDAVTTCRCERVLGRFERCVSLPCKVDAGKINAVYADGVLTVTLPKAEEAKLKQIPITIK